MNYFRESVLILVVSTFHQINTDQPSRVERSIQTAGYGCDVLKPSLLQEPIPETNIYTGTFYIYRMKSTVHAKSELSFGYVTWSGKRHPSGFQYVFADSHHNMEHYTEGAAWYKDSQWAFLKSREPGWYHFINCGFPFKYATWSNREEEDDGSGAFPMTLDIDYPGNHSRNDFLFKPVWKRSEGENVFGIVTKSFGDGIVSLSSTNYSGQSNFLQVESRSVWEARISKVGKQEEQNSLFIVEDAKDEDVTYPTYSYTGSYGRYGKPDVYYYRQRILFSVFISFIALTTAYVCYAKRSRLIQLNI